MAVFEVNESRSEIPISKVSYNEVAAYQSLNLVGYGCTKTVHEPILSEVLLFARGLTVGPEYLVYDFQGRNLNNVYAYNFLTTGKSSGAGASLCLGDSGGPVYLEKTEEIVGVNSSYTFKDSSGVSYVNTHVRLSRVKDWLEPIIAEQKP